MRYTFNQTKQYTVSFSFQGLSTQYSHFRAALRKHNGQFGTESFVLTGPGERVKGASHQTSGEEMAVLLPPPLLLHPSQGHLDTERHG